jgi:hypothetical protein
VIPAGGTGTLTAKIKTTTIQSGGVSKSIGVTTDAPGAQRLTLHMTFKSVPSVSVLPRPQVRINGVIGDQPTATVIVRRFDGEELKILGVENAEERLVITAKPAGKSVQIGRNKTAPGDILLVASLAPGVTDVSTNGRFRIKTNHPEAEMLDLTYSIRMRPAIEARPNQVRLLLQEGNTPGRTMLARVQHNLREQFKVTGATPSNPELFRVQIVDGDTKQQVHTVAVVLQDDVLPGSLANRVLESVVLTTDDQTQPRVIIPVLIEPKELRKPRQPRPLE